MLLGFSLIGNTGGAVNPFYVNNCTRCSNKCTTNARVVLIVETNAQRTFETLPMTFEDLEKYHLALQRRQQL